MELSPVVEVEGQKLQLSNLEKIYFPHEGYTKGHLLDYYAKISSFLLPHLIKRPLVLVRYPNGINGKFFYQKEKPAHAPDWLPTIKIPSAERGTIEYCLASEKSHLLWIINTGCIEVHPWLSRMPQLDLPTHMVFDLDPPDEQSYDLALETAMLLKTALDTVGLRGFIKTSGSTGLHVFVSLKSGYNYQETREAAVYLAKHIASLHPGVTLERIVKKRGKKLYLDCWQLAKGKTLASVYSVRPRPGAPVSMPVSWEEIKQGVDPKSFTITNGLTEIKKRGPLWPANSERQSLKDILKLMGKKKLANIL